MVTCRDSIWNWNRNQGIADYIEGTCIDEKQHKKFKLDPRWGPTKIAQAVKVDQLKKIQNELKAPKRQYNEFGEYNYRNCEDILEAVKPLLDRCTLTISDEMVMLGDRYYVKATAKLSDGEHAVQVSAFARETEEKKGMDAAQITGSASSYARKYALNGLFLIDDAKDDDNRAPTDKSGFKKQSPDQDKPVAEMSKAQREAILKAGRGIHLKDDDTRELVKWKAEKEGLDPNSWKVCKFFLGKDDDGSWNIEKTMDEYMVAKAETIA